MPKVNASNVVSFHELQWMRDWVHEVFSTHTGVYVLEQDGFVRIWLVNPDILEDLSGQLAVTAAKAIDEVTEQLLSETRLLPQLVAVFGGRPVDAATCEEIACYVAQKLTEHRVGGHSVRDRLEHSVIQALYESTQLPGKHPHPQRMKR